MITKELKTTINQSGILNIRIRSRVVLDKRGQFDGQVITIFPQANAKAKKRPDDDFLHRLSAMKQIVRVPFDDFVKKKGRREPEQGVAIRRILNAIEEQLPSSVKVFQIEADPDGPVGDAIREEAGVDFEDYKHSPLINPFYSRRRLPVAS